MLNPVQIEQLLRTPSCVMVFDGFDEQSRTIQGPFAVVGDCISASTSLSAAYIDSLPLRHGDLGIWFMPSLPPGEQYACKWLLQDCQETLWLACKYFAVRYRRDFHQAVARVVSIVSGEAGTFDVVLAERLSREMAGLRASPPARNDVIVFPEDLVKREDIIAAINRRLTH
jgi:hypothetical protein